VCRARSSFSCSQVQHFALKRDAIKAQYFWLELMSFYTAEEVLVEDETAKDKRAMRSTVGWGLRGQTPVVRDPYLTRGTRTSATTLFSHRGFEDWRYTQKTFRAESWQVSRIPSHA